MRALRWRRWVLASGVAALIAVGFAAYLRPEFIVDLANRWIFCW